jgi:hypothetical protein
VDPRYPIMVLISVGLLLFAFLCGFAVEVLAR